MNPDSYELQDKDIAVINYGLLKDAKIQTPRIITMSRRKKDPADLRIPFTVKDLIEVLKEKRLLP